MSAYLIGALIIALAFIGWMAFLFSKWVASNEASNSLVRSLGEVQQAYFREGYVFCDMWRVADIHIVAKKLGYTFDQNEVVKFLVFVKQHFDRETGINYGSLKRYIQMFARQLAKEKQEALIQKDRTLVNPPLKYFHQGAGDDYPIYPI